MLVGMAPNLGCNAEGGKTGIGPPLLHLSHDSKLGCSPDTDADDLDVI